MKQAKNRLSRRKINKNCLDDVRSHNTQNFRMSFDMIIFVAFVSFVFVYFVDVNNVIKWEILNAQNNTPCFPHFVTPVLRLWVLQEIPQHMPKVMLRNMIAVILKNNYQTYGKIFTLNYTLFKVINVFEPATCSFNCP